MELVDSTPLFSQVITQLGSNTSIRDQKGSCTLQKMAYAPQFQALLPEQSTHTVHYTEQDSTTTSSLLEEYKCVLGSSLSKSGRSRVRVDAVFHLFLQN